jgi:DNA-binding transcriptional LysR family regulator
MTDHPLFGRPNKAPPFTALRAVEAATRHRSYSAAARELQVTHAAISQSIKRLEQELDLKLFARSGQHMEPSPVAHQIAHAYSEAESTVNRALAGLFQRPHEARAIFAMPADLGRLWFTPRLERLSRDLPGVQVEMRAGARAGQEGDEVGIVVGYDPINAEGWQSEAVSPVTLFAVCSPGFRQAHAITRPRDLLDLPLLAEERWPWSLWLKAVGERNRPQWHSQTFDDANMTLDAAVRDHGVALTHIFLAEDSLRAATLCIPLPQVAPTKDALYLSWRTGSSEAVQDTVSWLHAELTATRDGPTFG